MTLRLGPALLACALLGACASSQTWSASDPRSGSTLVRRLSAQPPATRASPPHDQVARVAGRTRTRPQRDREAARCFAALRGAGVRFDRVARAAAPGVEYPIRLAGDVAGVEVRAGTRNAANSIMDCRLAEALVTWAPALKRAGVIRLDHYSVYRRNAQVAGKRKLSSHASAFAIDAARFHLKDGRVLNILDDWQNKRPGDEPCGPLRTTGSADERLLRDVVCTAAEQGIFQTVITPHYNQAHHNHVHLEISADPTAEAWVR